jgi:hypothetical protein
MKNESRREIKQDLAAFVRNSNINLETTVFVEIMLAWGLGVL